MTAADQVQSVQIACFRVGDGEYGLSIMQIKEIIKPISIRTIPRAPIFIEGIVELRGAFLPIVDLRRRFGLAVTEATRETKYIIAAVEKQIVGLVVDAVREVLRVDVEEIKAAPGMAVAGDARCFNGVYKRDERIIMLVDIDGVLSRDEVDELRQLGHAGEA